MNDRIEIPADKFRVKACSLWSRDWLLLSAGDFAAGDFNMMTVGWGSIGTMWGRPFVMVLVRPQRYTLAFIEKHPTFTLCAFPESCRGALRFCGSESGRDHADKARAAGLTPCAAKLASAPAYAEAELVIECRKSYVSTLKQGAFLNESDVSACYPAGDFHRVYFGDILRIEGMEKYLSE